MTGRERIQADEEKLFGVGGLDQVPPIEMIACHLCSIGIALLRLVCVTQHPISNSHPSTTSDKVAPTGNDNACYPATPQEKSFVGAIAGTILVGAIYFSLSGGSISGGINPYGVT